MHAAGLRQQGREPQGNYRHKGYDEKPWGKPSCQIPQVSCSRRTYQGPRISNGDDGPCRPADVLEPELDKVKETLGDLAEDIDDVLIGAIYPQTGMEFLKFRKDREAKTNFNKFKTLEEVKQEDELCEKALKGLLVEKE